MPNYVHCQCFLNIVEIYNKLSPRGEFEVVCTSDYIDDDEYDEDFSDMPWLAIPFTEHEKHKHMLQVGRSCPKMDSNS